MMRRLILNFHGIGAPGRSLETGEDIYWVEAETLEFCLEQAFAYRDVVQTEFTFDDGNTSDLAIAAPLLEQFGYAATIFPLAGRMDQPGSLGPADIRRLREAGHRIGNHGYGHVDWRRLDPAGEKTEWVDARERISEAAGQEVTAGAIPFGSYNRRVVSGLQRLGYQEIYCSDGGWADSLWQPTPRTSLRSDMGRKEIEGLFNQPTADVRRLAARFVKRVF